MSSARKGRPKSAERLLAKNDGKVFETKFGPMGMDEITKLYNKRRYATSAQKAGKEFVLLPMHRVRIMSTYFSKLSPTPTVTNINVFKRSFFHFFRSSFLFSFLLFFFLSFLLS